MKPIAEQDLYELLEVRRDAPDHEIADAWARMQQLCGPGSLAVYSLVSAEDAQLLEARLAEARTVLLDPVRRRRYDATLPGAANGAAARPTDDPGADVQRLVRPGDEALPLPPIIGARPRPAPPAPPAPAPAPAERTARAPIPLSAEVLASPPFAARLPSAPSAGAAQAAAPPPARQGPAPQRPLPRRPASEPELVLPEGTPYTGEVLRRAREARGISVDELCVRTKIARAHIENLEENRYDRLPAPVYLRGILVTLARELRLDGQKVARSYLEACASAAEKGR